MNKYFTTFKDIDAYNSFLASAELPNINVSYISDSDEVKYFKEHVSQTPFTLEIVSLPEGMTELGLSVVISSSYFVNDILNELSAKEVKPCRMKYSLDNGTTWSKWYEQNPAAYVINFNDELQVHEGDKIMLIGENIFHIERFFVDRDSWGQDIKVNISGNICSLLLGDDFPLKALDDLYIDPGYKYDSGITYGPFSGTFEYGEGISLVKVLDAGDLWFPSVGLPVCAFTNMFKGQNELVSAPNIYAKYLDRRACENMFYNCSSLTTMPDIYTETINGIDVFDYMFSNCSSLATVKPIRITKMIVPSDLWFGEGFIETFANCTALTAAPTWKVNQMDQEDTGTFYFARTFQGCTNMVTCDWDMFNVPNTHFGVNNMHGTFYDCSSLTTTPVMGSNTFETEVYPEENAFGNCTALSTVIWLATNIPDSFGDNWGTQDSGVLVLRDDWQTRWTDGDWIGTKIPATWTIKTWTQYQNEINA